MLVCIILIKTRFVTECKCFYCTFSLIHISSRRFKQIQWSFDLFNILLRPISRCRACILGFIMKDNAKLYKYDVSILLLESQPQQWSRNISALISYWSSVTRCGMSFAICFSIHWETIPDQSSLRHQHSRFTTIVSVLWEPRYFRHFMKRAVLSFESHPANWVRKDIFGHRTGGKPSFPKDPAQLGPNPPGSEGTMCSDNASHGRQRRIFSHAFSDRALKEQESMIYQYVEKLVKRLWMIAAAQKNDSSLKEA